MSISKNKLAREQAQAAAKKPQGLKKWLSKQITATAPVWDQAWNHPVRNAWAKQKYEQSARAQDEQEQFADLTIKGFKIDEYLPYNFDTNSQMAIWFSINPAVGIREKEKLCLIARGTHNPQCHNTLIYSSALLNAQAKKDLEFFAKENNITLIDIDNLNLALSSKSKQLLALAQLELKNIGKGGNPAAASDLIRWIPEIMEGSVYADIDLPLDPQMKGKANPPQKAGLPVVLNMGSITKKTKQKAGQEALSLNTDIIAYSTNASTSDFMEAVASDLITAYNDPFTALTQADANISKTAAFKKTQKANGTIFDLRMAVNQCKTIVDFYHFLGEDLFKAHFKLTPKSMENFACARAYNLKIPQLVTSDGRDLNQIMTKIKQDYYKPLVEEISGPGAVFKSYGGANALSNPRYRSNAPLPTVNTRALEGFGCSNGMTAFRSDNIPGWQTPEEQFKNMVFNAEGLSWLPSSP